MLYIIGLGLYDARDITLRGLDAVKNSDYVFLEGYTSMLPGGREELAKLYNKEIEVLGREGVEKQADRMLNLAKEQDVAFLVVGDALTATTHHDLFLRAKEQDIDVIVIPNAGILNAVALTGLDLYKFGRTTTLVYPEGSYRPTSFYDVIKENKSRGLHTLCLLDIKADQQRYMSVNEALKLLLEIAEEKEDATMTLETKAVGVARITAPDQKIVFGPVHELLIEDFGAPLHTLIIPGNLHAIEEEMLNSHD